MKLTMPTSASNQRNLQVKQPIARPPAGSYRFSACFWLDAALSSSNARVRLHQGATVLAQVLSDNTIGAWKCLTAPLTLPETVYFVIVPGSPNDAPSD